MNKIQLQITLGAVLVLLASCASHKSDVTSVGGLREAQNVIDEAKKEGAKTYAPATLKQAEQSLDAAAEVTKNNQNLEAADKATKDAQFQARRLLALTQESKALSNMNSEAAAIKIESDLAALRAPMRLKDMRDLSFDNQISQMKSAQSGKLEGFQETASFNERFNEVRKNFTESEAEVVRRGNDLVVRLKSVDFPSGKAEIAPQNYALLNKVQKTIKAFGEPKVIIEGHTDAVGSPKLNKILSLKRANAVKDYLVANNTLPSDKVNAVGEGADRPIASNTSAKGRAQNRRIDIIITPSVSATAE